MSTLKKTLCLVLALVMMLGLCAVSASATSFTDDAQIGDDYREAIEVLRGIGVYNGKPDGSLGPKDSLTRVQGCQLICNMLGAPKGAGFTSFTDVPASYSGVVAYCQTLGLVHGNGDNTFSPDEPLTGAAFAKFCLAALGYNCDIEGIMGGDWLAATNQLTIATGLAKGISGYDQSSAMTREQAGQMLLNTLKTTMVEYRGNVNVSTSEGVDVSVAGTRVNQTNTWGDDYRIGYSGAGAAGDSATKEFAEAYFPQLMLDVTNPANATRSQDLNVPTVGVWKYRGSELCRVLAEPVVSYSAETKDTQVSADLSGYYLAGAGSYINNARVYAPGTAVTFTGTTADAAIYVNGAPAAQYNSLGKDVDLTPNTMSPVLGVNSGAASGMTLAKMIANLTANGREIDFYATDGKEPNKITSIVITCYTAVKVKDVVTNGTATTYKLATVGGSGVTGDTLADRKAYSDAPADSQLLCDTAIAKGDIITVTYPQGYTMGGTSTQALYAYATRQINGTQTSWSSNNSVVVDGETYSVAKGVAKDDGYSALLNTRKSLSFDGDFNNNTEGNFYLDQFGYLVYSDAAPNNSYAFIVGAYGEQKNSLDGKAPSVTVRAVLSDGTVGTYTVKTEKVKANDSYIDTASVVPNTAASDDNGTYATYQAGADFAAGEYVIANTDIKVLGTGVADSDGTSDAAQILMSDHYGYVYKYTLNSDGDTITLYPQVTSAANGYGVGTKTSGSIYAGQTTTRVSRTTLDYTNATVALATTDDAGSTWTEQSGYCAAPGSAGAQNIPSAGKGTDKVVVSANTTVVIYDSKAKTATAQTGIAGLPVNVDSSSSGIGYYAAELNGNGYLNTKIIFISKSGGVPVATREYVYVNTGVFTEAKEYGENIEWFEAYTEDGSTISVRDTDDVDILPKILTSDDDYSGLYRVNENNVIVEKVWTAKDGAEDGGYDGPNNTYPYLYIAGDGSDTGATLTNGVLYNTSGRSWYTNDNTTIKYVKSGLNQIENATVYLVLEVSEGALTGYVKTIYVVDGN